MSRTWKIGSIGVGGYAAELIRIFDESIPCDRAKLSVVSSSRPEAAAENEHIQHQGSKIVTSREALLGEDLDAIIISTSIDSHLPYTKEVLVAGKAVWCEKPVTATVEEADAMIEARDASTRWVGVNFQDSYSPSGQWAKKKILSGAIGKVKRVKVKATWPRTDAYYKRNNWAGRIRLNGAYLLDSPANNALAHQLNLALYLTGKDMASSNRVTKLKAELYRAHPIENYDTCALRCETEAGCEVLILLTHACEDANHPVIDFEGEKGTVRRLHPKTCQLVVDGKVVEEQTDDGCEARVAMFLNYLDRLDGKVQRVCNEIENARAVTELVDGASECAVIQTLDRKYVKRDYVGRGTGEDDKGNAIIGIEQLFERCFERFQMPSEAGDVGWAVKPGQIDLRGYKKFGGVAGE